MLAFIFLLGLIIGFPLAGDLIEWIRSTPGLLPEGVPIIILHPLEAILLKLRLATYLGVLLLISTLLFDAAWHAGRNPAVRDAARQIRIPVHVGLPRALFALFCSSALALAGAFYSLRILLPMLFAYLHKDALDAGLQTEWQLTSWIGFIASMTLASMLAFQIPLLTWIVVRGGLVERDLIRRYRRHLWFTGFVLGALLSPPDPLSLFLVAGPMLVMFELALLLDRCLPSTR
jgi:sec-independent protein translocase protein TatC